MQKSGQSCEDLDDKYAAARRKEEHTRKLMREGIDKNGKPPTNDALKGEIVRLFGSSICSSKIAEIREEFGVSGPTRNRKTKVSTAQALEKMRRQSEGPEDVLRQVNGAQSRILDIAQAMRREQIVLIKLQGNQVDVVHEERNTFELPEVKS